ncbi:hypothetical protein [Streptomyces chumphonensis]|uniref:hypothetical protein n=1 Tax=Streptomyces chumphonensis TaxID=1214925 RepID=UPI003D73EA01
MLKKAIVALAVLLAGFALSGADLVHAQDGPPPAPKCVQTEGGYQCARHFEDTYTTEDGRTVTETTSNCVSSGTNTEGKASGERPATSRQTSSMTCSGSVEPPARH